MQAQSDYHATVAAFTRHFAQLMQREGARLLGPWQLSALALLRVELPNVLAALDYAVEHGQAAELRALAPWLWRYLNLIGSYDPQMLAYSRILNSGRRLGDRYLECQGLLGLGRLDRRMGRTDEAELHYSAALELADRPELEAPARFGLGLLKWDRNELDAAIELFQQAVPLYEAAGDRQGVGLALNLIGGSYTLQSRMDEAEATLQRSLEVLEGIGDRFGIAITLGDLGIRAAQLADYPVARSYFERALRLHRILGSRVGEMGMLNNLALLEHWQGNFAAALPLLQDGLAIVRENGETNAGLWLLNAISEVLIWLDRPREALPRLIEALETGLAGEYWQRVGVASAVSAALVATLRSADAALPLLYSALARSASQRDLVLQEMQEKLVRRELERLEAQTSAEQRAAAQAEGEALDLQAAAELALRELRLAANQSAGKA